MTDLTFTGKDRRFYFNWIPDVIFRPRKAFERIATVPTAIWITPLLVLTFMALANVFVTGQLKSQAALSGEITYPPDFQYYSPEQQAQYTQAIQSTQGPVFIYVLPSIAAIFSVWIGWLVLGGLLHLITTLFGGRGSTGISLNIVAWASLPLAARALVQIVYMLTTKYLISNPGLSGFSPAGDSGIIIFIGGLLKLVDIYIIWQIILLIVGVRQSTALSLGKSMTSVLLTVSLLITLQAGLSYLASVLGNLSITRPFFF